MSWVDVKDRLPKRFAAGRVTVQTANGDVTKAHFYSDKNNWLIFYGHKPHHWANSETGEPMFDVVKWREEEKSTLQ